MHIYQRTSMQLYISQKESSNPVQDFRGNKFMVMVYNSNGECIKKQQIKNFVKTAIRKH